MRERESERDRRSRNERAALDLAASGNATARQGLGVDRKALWVAVVGTIVAVITLFVALRAEKLWVFADSDPPASEVLEVRYYPSSFSPYLPRMSYEEVRSAYVVGSSAKWCDYDALMKSSGGHDERPEIELRNLDEQTLTLTAVEVIVREVIEPAGVFMDCYGGGDGTPVVALRFMIDSAGVPSDVDVFDADGNSQSRLAWRLEPGESLRSLLEPLSDCFCSYELIFSGLRGTEEFQKSVAGPPGQPLIAFPGVQAGNYHQLWYMCNDGLLYCWEDQTGSPTIPARLDDGVARQP